MYQLRVTSLILFLSIPDHEIGYVHKSYITKKISVPIYVKNSSLRVHYWFEGDDKDTIELGNTLPNQCESCKLAIAKSRDVEFSFPPLVELFTTKNRILHRAPERTRRADSALS